MICGTCDVPGFRTFQLLDQHWRSKDGRCVDRGWARVVELRQKGKNESAARVARRLLGIRGPEMDEATKAKLRQWREEHAEEIKDRRQQKHALRRRVKELASATTLRRKR